MHLTRTASILIAAAILATSNASQPPAEPTAADPQGAPPSEAPAPAGDATPPTDGGTGLPDAPEVTLTLKDGRNVTGLRVEVTTKEIVLWIEGIRARFPLEDVVRQIQHPSIESRYRSMRQAIGDNADQILELAGWLRTRGRHAWALAEVERAITLDPLNADAVILRDELAAQIILQQKAGRGKPRPARDKAPKNALPTPPLLTPEQIALIKVYEVDLDHPPRMVIPRGTVERLLDEYREHPLVPRTREGREAILRWRPREILDLMFRIRARNLYADVRIIDQLPAMQDFRNDINATWLANTCATNRCHGGIEAGRLWLHNRKPNSEAAVYTNYMILERFRLADGTAMLDFDDPADSPLIQFALPREDSAHPHPVVPHPTSKRDSWRPVFRSTRDRRVRQVVRWLESMYRPHPDYPIEFEPPVPPERNPTSTEPIPR